MSEFQRPLDREAQRVSPSPNAMDTVYRRALRRRRIRRVTTTILALAITAGGTGLAYTAFTTSDGNRPTAGPTASPTPGPTPASDDATPSPIPISLVDGAYEGATYRGVVGARQGLWRYAVALVEDLGGGIHHGGYVVVWPNSPRFASARFDTTTLIFYSGFIHEAERLRQMFFPGADIVRSQSADDSVAVSVVLGLDFAERHTEELAAFDLLLEFGGARVEGLGAERFLTEESARYYREDKDASLYGYAAGRTYEVGITERGGVPWDRNETGVEFYLTFFKTPDDFWGERIRVDRDESGALKIAEAFLSVIGGG